MVVESTTVTVACRIVHAQLVVDIAFIVRYSLVHIHIVYRSVLTYPCVFETEPSHFDQSASIFRFELKECC
jgi:hypothetical protein